MAYDRYDRDERSRWSDERSDRNWRENRGVDDRGFWDRASDEVASWFGDEDAERRRRQDQMHEDREWGDRSDARSGERSAFGRGWGSERNPDHGYGRNHDRDRSYGRDQSSYGGGRSDRDFNYDRGVFNRGGSSEREYNRGWRRDLGAGSDRDREMVRNPDWDRNQRWREDEDGGRTHSYRPMAGDYGRSDNERSGTGTSVEGGNYGARARSSDDNEPSQSPYGRDEARRTSFAGSRSDDRDFDPHYRSWRDRHMSDLDRDYDDYRHENQSRFENDFASWREQRQHKRGLLSQIREHMDVVGNDQKHVGTVDRTAGDRIILTKSDAESGGAHHSLSCSDIRSVEDNKVILDCSSEEAKNRWRDESRNRALFERDDQGEMGPRNLNKSFEGTYR